MNVYIIIFEDKYILYLSCLQQVVGNILYIWKYYHGYTFTCVKSNSVKWVCTFVVLHMHIYAHTQSLRSQSPRSPFPSCVSLAPAGLHVCFHLTADLYSIAPFNYAWLYFVLHSETGIRLHLALILLRILLCCAVSYNLPSWPRNSICSVKWGIPAGAFAFSVVKQLCPQPWVSSQTRWGPPGAQQDLHSVTSPSSLSEQRRAEGGNQEENTDWHVMAYFRAGLQLLEIFFLPRYFLLQRKSIKKKRGCVIYLSVIQAQHSQCPEYSATSLT